jgi:hypothetical protein
MDTLASFEARYAPLPYPTNQVVLSQFHLASAEVASGGVIELTNVTELSRIWMFPQNANAACNRN